MGRVLRREEWNNIIQQVNDLAQNPPEGTDCVPLDTLQEVDPGHIWTSGDVQAVRDKLTEICKDNVFSSALIVWKQEIIDEINAAIANGWCDCEEECLPECSNAQGIVTTYCGMLTAIGCEGIGDPEPGCSAEGRNQVTSAGFEAASKIGQWADAWSAYCSLKQAVEDLQDELNALQAQLTGLEQARDEACANGTPAQCAAAQAAVDAKQAEVDAKQAEVDQKTQEQDDKLTEADGYEQEAEAAAQQSTSLADSLPSCGSTTPLTPFIPSAPWADYECDQLGPECLGRDPRRCRPSWNLQRKTTIHFPWGGVFYGTWGTELSGGYTRSGTPYITYVRACLNHCNYACASTDCGQASCNWYEHEYRVNQSFPFPTGEECCD
jgi:hypothetical protein